MSIAEAAPAPAPIAGDFRGKSIVSINQFERPDVERVMTEADGMMTMVGVEGRDDLLKDLVIANLFYEPSTRTFLSFEAAAKRLGAATIATQGVEYSSISKGETLEDTIRTVDRYADTIDMRHSKHGAAAIAASVARVPVINGGDGVGEHPTQALLDLYTIKHKLGTAEDLTVTMVGDLKNGRTVHSLARLLTMYGVKLNYVSPLALAMPEEIVDELQTGGTEQYATQDLREVMGESDVVYMTRIQKERFKPEKGPFKSWRGRRQYNKVKNAYIVDASMMSEARDESMILMHPLPRVNEIHPEVDADPRAAYFDEVESGMYVRMALLALVNGRSILSPSSRAAADRVRMESWIMTSGKTS